MTFCQPVWQAKLLQSKQQEKEKSITIVKFKK